ncbi:MAG: 2-phosphoglycolate phosphatase [Alteromonadaceae bacterium]|jgi:2-phosphoglycolate phosphatase
MIKNKFTAVLFDLDGTLLDTANDLGEALNYVLIKHGFAPVDRERYRPVASDGAKGLLELGFGEQLNHFDYDVLRQEFLDHYQANIAIHTCLYPGISELLTILNERNIPWGVVTNKPEGLTSLLLPHFDEFKACKVIVGGDTLKERKPHPAPLLYACQKLSTHAAECIYVGDAPRDIEAGNRAGMYTIIAKWGYILATEQCNSWQACAMAESPEDILTANL